MLSPSSPPPARGLTGLISSSDPGPAGVLARKPGPPVDDMRPRQKLPWGPAGLDSGGMNLEGATRVEGGARRTFWSLRGAGVIMLV